MAKKRKVAKHQSYEHSAPAGNSTAGDETGVMLGSAINEIQVPSVLVGNQQGEIVITFSPLTKYVNIKFALVNENLRVTCAGKINKDCNFEFYFEEKDDRRRHFEIRARTVEKETAEPIEISYATKKDAPLGDAKCYWLTLKPSPKLAEDNVFVSIGRVLWYTSKKWYIRYPIMTAALIVALFYFGILSFERINHTLKTKLDYVQIEWIGNKQPYRYTAKWPSLLEATNDQRPNPLMWSAIPSDWRIVDGILYIKGKGMGFVRVPEALRAPYNYKARFKLRLAKNQRSAAWAFRAKDPQHYYFFELSMPERGVDAARLRGSVFIGQANQPLTPTTSTSMPYFPFADDDMLTVSVEAIDQEIKHTFTLTLRTDEGNPNSRNEGRDNIVTFFDGNNYYPYGTMGFCAQGENSEMVIEDLYISPID